MFKIRKNAGNIRNKEQSEMHQRKLDEVAKVNTQSSGNIQNELLKVKV
jgi:hypothetical protein